MRRVPLAIAVALALLIASVGCSPAAPAPATGRDTAGPSGSSTLAPVELAGGERLRIVATTTIVADVVATLAGDMADVEALLPIGADPHAFDPAPRDLAMLQDAHAIMANGADLEEFLETWLATAGEGVPVVYLSEGIELREFAPGDGSSGEQEHAHGGTDPHTWTSPANVMTFARNATGAMAALDPAHAEAYRANADAYVAQLQELDRWVQAQIATIPEEDRLLVTDHEVFGYYADRYGLEQLGALIPAFSSAAQPSAGELADLETAMREQGAKAVFVGTSVNPTLAERVAGDLGIQVVVLYTGSLGEPGSGAETYVEYTRYNTNAIVNALR